MRHGHDEGIDFRLEPERLCADFARLWELAAGHHAVDGGSADAETMGPRLESYIAEVLGDSYEICGEEPLAALAIVGAHFGIGAEPEPAEFPPA